MSICSTSIVCLSFMKRATDILNNAGDEDIYDLLDEIQLSYNDDKITNGEYTSLMNLLEDYI